MKDTMDGSKMKDQNSKTSFSQGSG